MLRILRWTALGLLLVALAAPAVQAQGGGIGRITAASGADSDPNGSPSASTLTPGSSTPLDLGGRQLETVASAVRDELPGKPSVMRETDRTLTMHMVAEALIYWFLL